MRPLTIAGVWVSTVALWIAFDTAAFADDPKSCDSMLMQAGLVDSDNRYEFVVPFDAEPECQCSPTPCEWHASKEDVVLSNLPKRPKEAKAPRVVCWGKR